MRTIAYPFLVIEEEEVIISAWEYLRQGQTWQVLPEYLPDWDYADSIRLRREVHLNVPAVAARFGCAPADLRVRLVVTFGTGGGRDDRVRRVQASLPMSLARDREEIAIQLEGIDVSQRFSLRTQILFMGPLQGCAALAPREPGQRLWNEVIRVQVEPDEQRFPIEAVSFRTAFPELAGAPWKLDWSPADPRDDFLGSFRLLINDDLPEFVARVSDGDPVTMRLLMAGVRLQIIRGILDHDDLREAMAETSQPTVGAAVGAWLSRAFPGEYLDSIRQAARIDPSRLDAAISALQDGGDDA